MGTSPALRNTSIIIVGFGIVLLCFIWGGLYYKIASEQELEINNALKQTANFARAFEEHTVRTIKSADQAVFFLKYQYEKEGHAIDIPKYVSEGRFANQPFLQLGVMDENAEMVASSQVPFVFVNLHDREHFQIHKNMDSGQLFISKPVLGRTTDQWSIQMARRVNKEDGSFGGVAVVSVNPRYFNEFYKQIDLGKNSAITLVGRDGIIRARQSGEDATVGQNISNSILMEKLARNSTGNYIATSNVDGIKRIYSYRALQDYPLIAMVGVDEEEALHSFKERVKTYIMLASVVSVVILFFILILLRLIQKQKKAEMELQDAHDHMETMVGVRTKELFIINQELEAEIVENQIVAAELRTKTAEVQQIAYFDVLTGLPNRAQLNERLTGEMEKAQQGAATGVVMFIDLDDLKTVNDVFGHTRGDALIIMAGSRIARGAGENSFVARIGGDEFIVLLPGIWDRQKIEVIVTRIIENLGLEFENFGDRFRMTASIGIAFYPTDGVTQEDILKNADNAMYVAKRAGKNCWRFYERAMHTETYEKMLLTNSLRQAAQRGELSLQYQPQVAIREKTIVGFEALLRWNSQEYGSISPTRFIPLAEQNGSIQEIGKWVLQQACQFIRQLVDAGRPEVYVGVNISSKQLATDDFVAIVRNCLTEANIQPCQLELEITESVLLVSVEDATAKLAKLHEMGVRLSLDDFGIGYSSLTYLCHLPVDTLKIDKSFVDMIETDGISTKIIGSIIAMAHMLNMKVIAEGVETTEQLEYLLANDCDCIQGYLFSRPVPPEKAIKLLTLEQ